MIGWQRIKFAYNEGTVLIEKINKIISNAGNFPRWLEHILFWLAIGWTTWGQFSRQFAPVPGLTPDPIVKHLIWIEQLGLSMLSFWAIGYYVLPRFWYKSRPVQTVFFLALYWLISSSVTELIFRTLAGNYPPIPRYLQARITMYETNTWVGYFTDAGLFFFNWAHNFSYVLIPLLIKAKRDEKKKKAVMDLMEQEKLVMELSFLRSQINPHFLFNAFNNLYGLIRRNDKIAAGILADLSDVMRYALYRTKTELVPLKGELRFLANYLRLEGIRITAKKHISCTVEGDPGSFGIPPMIIVCFVENAFKHGLDSSLNKSYIDIKMHIDYPQKLLIMRVVNSTETAYTPHKEGGIGIANVRKRLDLLYPDNYQLTLTKKPNEYHVELKLPLKPIAISEVDASYGDDEALPFPYEMNPSASILA